MTTTAPPLFLIGNRYQITAVIAQNAPWTTYRAHDVLTDQTVTLKRFTPTHSTPDGGSAVDLTRLLGAWAALRHPNLHGVIEFGADAQHSPFFTLPPIEDSRDIVSTARLMARPDRLRLLGQMVNGVRFIHARGLAHGRLTAECVRVTHDGAVRLTDFSLDIPSAQVQTYDRWSVGAIVCTVLEATSGGDDAMPNPDALDSPALRSAVRAVLDDAPGDLTALAEALEGTRDTAAGPGLPQITLIDPYIGRETELARLRSACESARRGAGGCWLIGGESGIGKSRLLDEIRLHALAMGALVVRGQAVAEGGLPYQLWREPARRLLLSGTISDSDAAILKEIVPDVALLLRRAIPDAPPLESADNQRRLVATLVRLLLQQRQLVVLVLEDLQWTAESLEPLKPLSTLARDMPVLILCSYRDDDAPTLPDVLPGAERITLRPLDPESTARLSASLIDQPDPDTARWIERESAGNPFLVIEAAHAARESTLTRRPVRATITHSLIDRRLARVPASAVPLIRLAAILGRQIDRAVLCAAQPGVDIDAWLLACDRAAILTIVDGRWAFVHDRLRDAFNSALTPQESAALHRMAAEAIESVYGGDPAFVLMLYDHWRAAGDPVREAEYAWRAGLERKRVNSLKEARATLERALLLNSASDASAGERQRAIALTLGEVCWTLADYPAAEAALSQATALAEAANDRHTLANALFWSSQIDATRGDYDAARQTLWRAFGAVDQHDSETLSRVY